MIDIRNFDQFLNRTGVRHGLGVAEYDDSYEDSRDNEFYVAFWCDTDDVDEATEDVEMLCYQAEDDDTEFVFNGVWDATQMKNGIYVKAQFSYNA